MTAREKLIKLAQLIEKNKTKYLIKSSSLFGATSIMKLAKQITEDISTLNEAIYVLAKHDALAEMS